MKYVSEQMNYRYLYGTSMHLYLYVHLTDMVKVVIDMVLLTDSCDVSLSPVDISCKLFPRT